MGKFGCGDFVNSHAGQATEQVIEGKRPFWPVWSGNRKIGKVGGWLDTRSAGLCKHRHYALSLEV
jgi:hypothetical protein